MRKTHLLGYAGFSGIFIFAISILLLHGWQPEISIRYDAMSYYVYGQLGWLLWAGLLGLGLGSLALAAGFWRIQQGAYARVGILCAGIWGTGLLIAAIFPTDPKGSWNQPPSTRGMIHFAAAILAFIGYHVGRPVYCPCLHKRRALEAGSKMDCPGYGPDGYFLYPNHDLHCVHFCLPRVAALFWTDGKIVFLHEPLLDRHRFSRAVALGTMKSRLTK
ncbi:DUF998 domain-containing protein [Paenibacillus woosongensis]|uniref:DUF998 domain-containing protein n=1 Tax=Paenibacillus woosongensis TaxID=307580 RepID=A0A7X2YXJ7_9BACL|nr:DUF998 domain-containing protein [Paenibacillus woosongensis]MUG43731.1 DUF998 domain-containing protein [Paenibacillus woosongensis]